MIGTHKAAAAISSSRLGLMIIRPKEQPLRLCARRNKLKAPCAAVDVWTLTPQPIPRTRTWPCRACPRAVDFATPTARRLSVATFVMQQQAPGDQGEAICVSCCAAASLLPAQ